MDYPKSVPNVGLVNGKFVDENTTTGQVGSLIPSGWGNAVTDELLNVIRAGGDEPAEAEHDQLLEAIKVIVRDSIPPENIRTTLAQYGITDAYTKVQVEAALAGKASKSTTLSGYGITDAFTKAEVQAAVSQATEAKQGTAKVASQLQMNAGTDDTAMVTPKKNRAGFSIMTGPAGYVAFPTWLGGFVILWNTGAATTAETSQSIPYPVSLTEGVWCHYVSTHIEADNAGANGNFQTVGAPGLSSCRVYSQVLGSLGVAITPKLFLLGR